MVNSTDYTALERSVLNNLGDFIKTEFIKKVHVLVCLKLEIGCEVTKLTFWCTNDEKTAKRMINHVRIVLSGHENRQKKRKTLRRINVITNLPLTIQEKNKTQKGVWWTWTREFIITKSILFNQIKLTKQFLISTYIFGWIKIKLVMLIT